MSSNRSRWDTYLLESGNTWSQEAEGIFSPNDDLDMPVNSTHQLIELANGDTAFVTPAVNSREGVVPFTWNHVDESYKDKILGYIGEKLKIVDDQSNELIGRFLRVSSTRISGIDAVKYNIVADFERG